MNTTTFKEQIKTGAFDKQLLRFYPEEILEEQRMRYASAIEEFENHFCAGDAFICSAPGRTEISGNHTDHQHGEVLAAAVHLDAIAVARKNDSSKVRIVSKGYPQFEISTEELKVDPALYGTTQALVKGVMAGFANRGYAVAGFDAYITSDVPVGSGLSSSASLEVLIGTILSHEVSPVERAQIGQYAENVYFGKPCGLMDQMACAVGNAVHIDFKNPAKPIVEQVSLPLAEAGYCLCITDTKGSHADLTPEYAAIVQEMKAVAAYFGKEVLGDVEEETVLANLSALREHCGDRSVLRALHFYRENARVREECDALKKGDLQRFLSLVQASGDSSYKYLQNIYVSQLPAEQNLAIALQLSEIILRGTSFAARVHGGGFAGTIQAFVERSRCEEYQRRMNAIFGEDSCRILFIRHAGPDVIDNLA